MELSSGANVFLVDSSNFSAFKAGRQFTHYGRGGLMTRTPHDFGYPEAGRWYIVAHSWGLRNAARVSVRPLQTPQAMPPATPSLVDLRSIARNAAHYSGSEEGPPVATGAKDYDVFISHATEDKDAVMRPLAHALP